MRESQPESADRICSRPQRGKCRSARSLLSLWLTPTQVLECIDVSFIPLIGNCLVKALSKCPKLRKLSLSYNPEEGLITNKSFFWFNQKLRKGSYRWDEHHDHYK